MKLILDDFNKTIISSNPKSILDVGCGRGRYFEWAKSKGLEYTGLEVDRGQVKEANAKYETKNFRSFNGYDLSMFGDNSYDVILLVEVMEHVKDDETLIKLLKECIRVAQKYIFFTTPNSSDEQFLIDHRLIYHHFTHSVGPEFKIHIGKGRKDNPHLHHLKFTKERLSQIIKPLARSFIIEKTVPLDIRSTREPDRILYFKLWGVIDCQEKKKIHPRIKKLLERFNTDAIPK